MYGSARQPFLQWEKIIWGATEIFVPVCQDRLEMSSGLTCQSASWSPIMYGLQSPLVHLHSCLMCLSHPGHPRANGVPGALTLLECSSNATISACTCRLRCTCSALVSSKVSRKSVPATQDTPISTCPEDGVGPARAWLSTHCPCFPPFFSVPRTSACVLLPRQIKPRTFII